jgi:3'-phosphoadenosine 5'-phosphosulfate sulfotransferase (PAPS reductase)/FAD synthetase
VSKNLESFDDWITQPLMPVDPEPMQEAAIAGATDFDPLGYDRYVVAFSGGKDSLALLLHLLDLGVSRDRIELHHHLVDGREGSTLMDWPITESYCEAVAQAFGVRVTYSWREGGIEREMLRDGTATAPVWFPAPGGGHMRLGGEGPAGTRRKFPQVSASLSTRWCSAAAKIDVFARYLNNHPVFCEGKTLVLTGERAQESRARANYRSFEPHRCDNREGRKVRRHIDLWRAVHAWSEHEVWELIRKWRVCPHPSYWLSWGRTSCRTCIFGSKHQWATIRAIAPEQFESIATYEREFGVTIHRTKPVTVLANEGTPYECDPFWVDLANSRQFDRPVFMDPWVLPPGAFGESCGPT